MNRNELKEEIRAIIKEDVTIKTMLRVLQQQLPNGFKAKEYEDQINISEGGEVAFAIKPLRDGSILLSFKIEDDTFSLNIPKHKVREWFIFTIKHAAVLRKIVKQYSVKNVDIL